LITLTRFNHSQFVVNADLIEFLESTPDTVVSLVTSKKVLVLESVDEVVKRIIEYRKKVGGSVLHVVGTALDNAEAEA